MGEGDDELFCDDGDDWLNAAQVHDSLDGGDGDDIFVFAAGSGRDVVLDLAAGGTDNQLDLSQSTFDFQTLEDVSAHARQTGNSTVIDLGNGDTFKLVGVLMADLTFSDFIF